MIDKKSEETEDKPEKLKIKSKSQKAESERDDLTKKQATEEELKEDTDREKKETKKQVQKVTKKEKLPIIPYKIDPSYQEKLITALKKHNTRPKSLMAPDNDDIRENIGELVRKEAVQEKLDEVDELKAELREKEIQTFLNKYKESAFSGNTLVQDPYALFSGAQKVYIDQFYKLSDLFILCPYYFSYRISLEYCISGENSEEKKYEAYHLFNTKEFTPSILHDCFPNQARQININIFNFIVDPKERDVQKFITMTKPCRCAVSCFCACCTRPTFIVETPIEEIGRIVETRTLCDPVVQILDINNDVIYNIITDCSDCGYCCRDHFCDSRRCAICEFIIYDGQGINKLGKIKKDHRSGKLIKPDYDQMEITYPAICSCQDKILIMCAALAIEYLYFQNMTNIKRCNGRPKFINTPY